MVFCALWTPPQADGGDGHAPCGPFKATTLTLPAHPAEVKYMFQDGPTSPAPQLRSYALLRTRGAGVICWGTVWYAAKVQTIYTKKQPSNFETPFFRSYFFVGFQI